MHDDPKPVVEKTPPEEKEDKKPAKEEDKPSPAKKQKKPEPKKQPKKNPESARNEQQRKLAEKKADTIAFGTYGDAKNYDVTVLKIDGKHPTDTGYPYAGELALIYKEKNYSGSIKEFVSFAKSNKSHAAIKEAGGMPM